MAKNWTLIIGGYQSYVKYDNNQFFATWLNAFNFARNVYNNVFAGSCMKGGPCVNVTIEKHLDISMEAQMGYASCLSYAMNQIDQYNKWVYQAIDYEYNNLKIKVQDCTNPDGSVSDSCLLMNIDPNFTDLWAWVKKIMVKLSVTSDVGYTLGQCISFNKDYAFNKLRTYQLDFNKCTGWNWFTGL